MGLASRVGAGAAARLRLSAEGAARWLFIPCTMAPRTPDPSRTLPHPGTKRGHPSPARPWCGRVLDVCDVLCGKFV